MPRPCTICTHDQRQAIDAALVAGGAFRGIARQYAVSDDALRRHKQDHIPQALAQAQEAADVAHADDLLAQVRELQAKTQNILVQAEAAGDLRTALGAIREARGNLELLARLLGELNESRVVNIYQAPEWISLRTVIVGALDAHPEARMAVVQALEARHE